MYREALVLIKTGSFCFTSFPNLPIFYTKKAKSFCPPRLIFNYESKGGWLGGIRKGNSSILAVVWHSGTRNWFLFPASPGPFPRMDPTLPESCPTPQNSEPYLHLACAPNIDILVPLPSPVCPDPYMGSSFSCF